MSTVLTAAPPAMTMPKAETRAGYRITSIDFLRGLVMVIMALDHTRDFFHQGAMTGDPTDMQTTTPFLFFTRWITHFCAPVFVFLAGASAYLQGIRKTKKELSAFLIKRGFWLILVELFLITLAISFDIRYSIFFLQTIWAIGISMVLLGLAIWLPFGAILAIGGAIVLGHNGLDYYEAQAGQNVHPVIAFLHRQTFYPVGSRAIGNLYPFLPWTGLMLVGYAFGKVFTLEAGRRKRLLWQLGGATILLFVALRAINAYGDPAPWKAQPDGLFTVLSFLNTTKYPPSLLYTCMTIGPALLLLAAFESVRNRFTGIITVFGRVPFLYYVMHFYLIHLVSALLFLARGHSFAEGAAGLPNFPFKFVMPGEGLSLGMVYLVWILVVAALYPVCRWFSRYKATHKQWWLSYV